MSDPRPPTPPTPRSDGAYTVDPAVTSALEVKSSFCEKFAELEGTIARMQQLSQDRERLRVELKDIVKTHNDTVNNAMAQVHDTLIRIEPEFTARVTSLDCAAVQERLQALDDAVRQKHAEVQELQQERRELEKRIEVVSYTHELQKIGRELQQMANAMAFVTQLDHGSGSEGSDAAETGGKRRRGGRANKRARQPPDDNADDAGHA